jgi:uncharacterized protein (DUF58 family)
VTPPGAVGGGGPPPGWATAARDRSRRRTPPPAAPPAGARPSGAPPRGVDHGAAELLRRLELAVTRTLDGLLQGDHQGFLPGPGSEPGEARPYQAGDDVRRMDWSVTARTTVPHVRMPIADHELETWMLVDLSASIDFGTAWCEKRDLVLAAAAAVGHLTSRAGNRIGALVVRDGLHARIPARAGRAHLLGLLHTLASTPRAPERHAPTDLGAALDQLARVARRRGLVVVLSDFLSVTDWSRPVRLLAARHDVVAVQVVDPRELELPDVGTLTLVDAESGAVLEVQTADRGLRARYGRAAAAHQADIAHRLRAAGADQLILRTDRPWLLDLVGFVDRRRRHRTAAPAGAAR